MYAERGDLSKDRTDRCNTDHREWFLVGEHVGG